MALAGIRWLCSQRSVSAHAYRTQGVTGSKRREGANGVVGGIGVVGGNGDGNGGWGGSGDVKGDGDGDGVGRTTGMV